MKISSAKPSSLISGPSFFFHRCCNIVILGHDISMPDIDGATLFIVLMFVLYTLLMPWLLWHIGVASQPMTLI
jgi:hypothetical protein